MANVYFRRGVQADLPESSIIDGAFYLTTDTHRLYVGQATSTAANAEVKLQLLNQNIHIITAIDDLPTWTGAAAEDHRSDVYYSTKENILAIWTLDPEQPQGEQTYKWVQINPDTDTRITSLTTSATDLGNNVNGAQYVITANKQAKDGETLNATTSSPLIFKGYDGIEIKADTATNSNAIKVIGDVYNLVNDITSTSGTEITNTGVTLGLQNKTDATDSAYHGTFTMRPGDNISFQSGGNGVLTIKGKDFSVKPTTTNGSTFSSSEGTLTLNIKQGDNVNSAALSVSNVGIKAIDSSDSAVTIPLNTTSTSETKDKYVYTAAAVDKKINSINGMTYMGTIGSTGATITELPTTSTTGTYKPKIGDTYCVIDKDETFYTNTGLSLKNSEGKAITKFVIGDLLIATGTETDGYITSNLAWTYIPAGDESLATVTYQSAVDTANHEIKLTDSTSNKTVIQSIKLNPQNEISVTSTTTTKGIQYTIGHATHTASVTTASTNTSADDSKNTTFEAITGLTVNSYGHVTGYTSTTYTIPKDVLKAEAPVVTENHRKASFPIRLKRNDENLTTNPEKLHLTSESLSFENKTDNGDNVVNVELKWESF